MPYLDLCIPFNCCNALALKYAKSPKPELFLDFSQTEMTHFPTLSYTSISKREYLPFHIPKAEIGSPFRVKPPRIGQFWGYPPGMCSGDKERQSWKQLSVPIVP